MKCANPTLCYIDQDSNKRIFRSWDKANDAIKQNDHIPFNCGKCIACRKRQSLELARRCVLHASLYQQNCFLTLAYENEHVGDNTITYSDIQKFKKRLRESVAPKKIEIFNVHEYMREQQIILLMHLAPKLWQMLCRSTADHRQLQLQQRLQDNQELEPIIH